ncbi:MAG: PaaI family thioesterase [Parvularculaceae bacterium]|nr:PaaI family thioesterase [Parvularculaceae bacterium]
MAENLAEQINAANTPLAKFMGIWITVANKDRIEGEMPVRPELCTVGEKLHGGAMMAMADNLGALGAFLNLPPGAGTTTIESSTKFLRPTPVGTVARGVATPVRIGKTLQVWETKLYDANGELTAVVMQTQLTLK